MPTHHANPQPERSPVVLEPKAPQKPAERIVASKRNAEDPVERLWNDAE